MANRFLDRALAATGTPAPSAPVTRPNANRFLSRALAAEQPATVEEDEPSLIERALPTATRIAGPLAGGIAGAKAGAAIGAAGGPIGVGIGGALGAAVGGILGEVGAEKLEGRELDAKEIALSGALSALPGGPAARMAAKPGLSLLGRVGLHAAEGASQGLLDAGTRPVVMEGRAPTIEELGYGATAGAVLGGTLGTGLDVLTRARPMPRELPTELAPGPPPLPVDAPRVPDQWTGPAPLGFDEPPILPRSQADVAADMLDLEMQRTGPQRQAEADEALLARVQAEKAQPVTANLPDWDGEAASARMMAREAVRPEVPTGELRVAQDRRQVAEPTPLERRRTERRAQIAQELGLPADHAAVERLHAVEVEARTDPLTGLMNKRGWEELLSTVAPEDHVVVLDMRRLKPINDKLGHAAGDQAIKTFAGAVREVFGEGEAARFGGDEMGAVLRGMNRQKAEELVETFRRSAANRPTVLRNPQTGETLDIPGFEAHIGVGKSFDEADVAANIAAEASRKGGRGDVPIVQNNPGGNPPVEATPGPARAGLGDRPAEVAPLAESIPPAEVPRVVDPATPEAVTPPLEAPQNLEDGQPLFRTAKNETSEPVGLDHVRRAFSGRDVSTLEDGAFRVALPNGRNVRVQVDGSIELDPAAFAKGRPGESIEGQRAVGSYQRIGPDAVIRLAKQGGDAATLDHEAFHAAMDMVLTPAEKRAVLKAFGDSEEKAADSYARWQPTQVDGVIGRTWARIKEFFSRIAEGLGLRDASADDVFGRVRSGEAFGRRVQDAAVGQPRMFSLAAELVGDRVENFQRWFGRSRVIDDDGAPLRVYHGTNRSFTEFSRDVQTSKTGNPNARLGFFFTRNPHEASRYTEAWGKQNGQVIPVYLSVSNPYEMPYREFNDLAMAEYRGLKDGATREELALNRQASHAAAIARRNELAAAGYDGIVVNRGKPTEEWIAFEPTQIKSAIGNRGTFDSEHPDIRYKATSGPKYATAPVDPPQMPKREEPTLRAVETPAAPEMGRPMDPGEAPRVETKVEQLREVAPDAKLSRDTPRTWESLDKPIRAKLNDILSNETKEAAFYERARSGKLNDVDVQTLDALVAGKREKYDAARQALLKAQESGKTDGREGVEYLKAALDQATVDLAKAARSDIEAGTKLARALAARARVMKAVVSADNPDALLRLLLKQIPEMSERQAADLMTIYRERPQDMSDALRAAMQPKTLDKYLEFWKNGLVSAPGTQVANVLGNVGEQIVRLGETATSALLDPLVGGPRTRLSGEARFEFAGAARGASKSLGRLAQDLKDIVSLAPEKIDIASGNFERQTGAIGGRVGRAVRIPFRLLGAFDTFTRGVGGEAELHKLAYRRANGDRAEAARLISNPPEDLVAEIQKAAAERTFQNPNRLADSLVRMRADHKWLHVVMPFIQTPANIASLTIQRSPAGFVGAARAFQAYRKAVASQADAATIAKLKGEAIDKMSRPLVGTMLLGTFAAVAKAGGMTGSGPTDDRERNQLRESGWQPYSFVVPADMSPTGTKAYIPFNRFEPLSSILGIAADMIEAKDQKTAGDLADKALGSIVQNLTSKTYLQGLADAAAAINDPKQFMGQYVSNLAGSVVPNVVAKTAQAIDPALRDVRPESSGLASIPERVGKTIQSRIPGASLSLPQRRSGTGEPIERQGNAVTRLLLPSQPSAEDEKSEFSKMLVDLEAVPSAPRKEIKVKGREVRLTDEEYASLQDADLKTTEKLRKIVDSPAFKRLDQQRQQSIIKNYYDRGRADARNRVLRSTAFRSRLRATPMEAR